ncbi:SAF domain-containing protein [Nonomuraea sp. NPDC050328]|uniref:SAF domain-containing protein n=1 Tax=Nonomuraea sp. NPDC050328 TaxID=3364361 RepID=UPI0037B24D22
MHAWIRRFGRRRRLIAAVLTGVALLCVLSALRPGAGSTVQVLVAARDLAPGVLGAGDAHTVRLPRAVVPDGALAADPVGKVLAAPMRRGEPFTDVRLLGDSLLARLPAGQVATPVRIADPDAARLVRPGSTIGVLASWDESPAALPVADAVTVLSTPSGNSEHGALLVLGTTPEQAAQLAAAQAGGRLSIILKHHSG